MDEKGGTGGGENILGCNWNEVGISLTIVVSGVDLTIWVSGVDMLIW